MPIEIKGKTPKAMLDEYNRYIRQLPTIAGNEAVNFFKQSFIRQGWIDKGGVQKWDKIKKPPKGKRRAILVNTGRLKRSIRIISTSPRSVIVGTDVPYAKIQNEGGTIKKTVSVRSFKRRVKTKVSQSSIKTKKTSTKKRHTGATTIVKSHSRKMNLTLPPRPFMGNSEFLNRRLKMLMEYSLKQILK